MSGDNRTRRKLIEAAGVVFAEKGYDRATAREICEKAGVNPASVNYHFGGRERLYVEVLREAHRRLTNLGTLTSILADDLSSEAMLEKLVTNFTRAILAGTEKVWEAKLFVRELVSPSSAFAEVAELQIRPVSLLLRGLVSRVMGLPLEHPAVFLGTMSTVSQFLFLLQSRPAMRLVVPEFDFPEGKEDVLARHILRFVSAGLKAAAAEASQYA